MTAKQMHSQFGSNPELSAVLVWAIQHAFKRIRTRHPDMKRQRSVRMRDLTINRSRQAKQCMKESSSS